MTQRFNVIHSKIPRAFEVDIVKNPKIHAESKISQRAKIELQKNKVGLSHILVSKCITRLRSENSISAEKQTCHQGNDIKARNSPHKECNL